MIRFALRCADGHTFESWFRDGASFDVLVRDGLLGCPECGSPQVEKALMAPAVMTSRKRAKPAQASPVPESQPQTPTTSGGQDDARHQHMRALLKEMRDHVVRHARDVGEAFATEARRMHEGETEQAAIRGIATPEDVRSLLDDGIEVTPLPAFPDDRN